MATPPTPNDLTRQQLDELDALLQRMLALPLNQSEPAVPFRSPPPLPELPSPPQPRPAPGWRADVPAPAAKAPYLAPSPAAVPEPEPAIIPAARAFAEPPPPAAPQPRLYAPPAPSPATDYLPPPGGPGTLRGVDAPALPFGYQAPEQPHPAEPDPEPPVPSVFGGMNLDEVNPFADPAPQPAAEPEPTTDPVPVALWPLFATNWLIEFVLGWFGPLGALLTRPWMKTLLGWAGVLLLAGAGVWAARGKGWVRLPWPR
jgi:hypothetical protein